MAPSLEDHDLSDGKGAVKTCLLVGLGQRTREKTIPALSRLIKDGHVSLAGGTDPLVQSTPIDGLPIYSKMEDFFRTNHPPNMAYVAIPHSEYVKVLPELFGRGIDVLKEKPIACNGDQARELKTLAEKNGVQLGVLCQRRFSKRYNMLELWLPLLGRISSVRVAEAIDVPRLDAGWRARNAVAGGGVVLDMGYHMLDQLVGMFGRQFTVEYVDLMKTRAGDYDVEDTAHIAVKFQPNITATIVLSRSGASNEERISIIGEKGILTLDGDLVRLSLRDEAGRLHPHEEYIVREPSSLLLEKGFSSFLNSPKKGTWDIERDIAVMEMIDEIYRFRHRQIETNSALSPLTKPWSWPRVTRDVEVAVDRQLHNTLSIYNNGGILGQFEKLFKEYHGSPDSYTLLHNSGTNALHAVYYAAGFGPGDEIIVPVYTFHATVSPLMHLGVKPVFVDAHPETGNIDPSKIRHAITPKTKAVIVTHMWGIPCAMKEIIANCREASVHLLEDCSHAHGASINGLKVGTFGDGAAWSIQGDKVLSGGEGGVSLTVHPEIYYRQLIHGHYNKRCKSEIPRGHPLQEFAITGTGLKNRVHPLAISIAHNQLQKLPEIVKGKTKCASYFIKTLSSVPFLEAPVIAEGVQPAWYALIFRFDPTKAPSGLTRERFVEEVKARGMTNIDIPNSTRPLYDEALYRRPWEVLGHVYARGAYVADWKAADFPGANKFHSSVIKLSVWAYEDDWSTIKASAQVMLEVSNDLMKASK